MGSGPAGRYRRVNFPGGAFRPGAIRRCCVMGTTTRRAPGTTWTSRGISPITSPSPWTRMGRFGVDGHGAPGCQVLDVPLVAVPAADDV